MGADGATQQSYLRREAFVQVIDPDGGIDHHHRVLRPLRLAARSPCQRTFPANFSMSSCSFSRTSRRKPSSTAAFLVARPLAFCARAIKSSSMSILVRIGHLRCVSMGDAIHILLAGQAAG